MQSCVTLALKGFDRLFLSVFTHSLCFNQKALYHLWILLQNNRFCCTWKPSKGDVCAKRVCGALPVPVQPPEKGSNSPSRLWKLSSDHQNLKTDFVI